MAGTIATGHGVELEALVAFSNAILVQVIKDTLLEDADIWKNVLFRPVILQQASLLPPPPQQLHGRPFALGLFVLEAETLVTCHPPAGLR